MLTLNDLKPFADYVLADNPLPEWGGYYGGKVRENYDRPDGTRLIIASDRISAFDRILASVPFKGQILTQIARFWFEATADICPNHVLSYPDPNAVLCKRLKMLPVEIIVRGYLAGTTSTSVLTMYRKGQRHMYGVDFPDGMVPHQKLPTPIVTPTTKGDLGAHDEPLSPHDVVARGLLTQDVWDQVATIGLRIFERGQIIAAQRGLILADTKYELGIDENGCVVLADEIHTPDSSRYWLAEYYQEALENGTTPRSLDKDFIRNWVNERCDPYKDELPSIPTDVILQAALVYIQAYEKITGQTFVLPEKASSVRERIRKNVSKLA